LQAGATVVDGLDRVASALKQDLDRRKNRPVVIDDENARHDFLSDGLPLKEIRPFNRRLHEF
jgi:hypothetical protein